MKIERTNLLAMSADATKDDLATIEISTSEWERVSIGYLWVYGEKVTLPKDLDVLVGDLEKMAAFFVQSAKDIKQARSDGLTFEG